MKKKYTLTLLIILSILILSGCTANETGNSLHAFTERMNNFNENYSLSENGYIFNEREKTLSRFYKFNENEILIKFTCDENNNLSKLDIVFPITCTKSTKELKFIKDCIRAYVNSEEIYAELLEKTDFDNTVNKVSYKTTEADNGDIDMMVDVTAIGSVITIMQNNL